METWEKEDLELLKWARWLGLASFTFCFLDLFFGSAPASPSYFIVGAMMITAGSFHFMRYKKFKSPYAGLNSATWLIGGVYFLIVAFVLFFVRGV